MKLWNTKRLRSLERVQKHPQRSKCALVVCDPDILQIFDFSFIQADHVLILPDNGHRLSGGLSVGKGGYTISYF